MEPMKVNYGDLIYYVLLAGVLMGIVLGLIPLILGIRKQNRKYGMYGFIGSVIGGAITPIISIIVVSIFSWLILRKSKNDVPANSGETSFNENSDSEISR